jgi:hypothetical protein
MNSPASRPSLADSPWFWVYLFTTFALVVLLVMRPQVQERQAQIERKEQGRQRALERAAGQSPRTPLSTPESTRITLTPLLAILGLVWIAAAIMVVRHYLRRPPVANSASLPHEHST